MKDFMILLIACIFTTGHLVAQTAQANENVVVSSHVAEIKWDAEVHDFGTIEKDVPVSYEFKFTNTSQTPLLITNVKASCGCTATNYPQKAVDPGETASITATYNASATGSFTKTITVYTNIENSVKVLRIKGTVK